MGSSRFHTQKELLSVEAVLLCLYLFLIKRFSRFIMPLISGMAAEPPKAGQDVHPATKWVLNHFIKKQYYCSGTTAKKIRSSVPLFMRVCVPPLGQ